MNFHETVMGQRFFERQLPQLIVSLKEIAASLKEPRPIMQPSQNWDQKELLTRLYYTFYDTETIPDREAYDACKKAISQMQSEIREGASEELWQKIEHTYAMIATCSADEREWAFSVGFRAAMNMTACGWITPKSSGKDGA